MLERKPSAPMPPLPDGMRNITTIHDLTPEQRENIIIGPYGSVNTLCWIWKNTYQPKAGDPMPENPIGSRR